MKNYDLSELTVLIVDKQQPMRTLLRAVLREFGVVRIHDANDPEKGFEEFNRVMPDLVLVDWCPEFDGIGLVKRIRADNSSCFPQVPIIMVTAFGETKRICEARDAGMSEYLVKPVSASLLYTRIVAAIESVRPFIRSKTYTGPCRRRHKLPFAGEDRRETAKPEAVVHEMPRKSPGAVPPVDASAPAEAA